MALGPFCNGCDLPHVGDRGFLDGHALACGAVVAHHLVLRFYKHLILTATRFPSFYSPIGLNSLLQVQSIHFHAPENMSHARFIIMSTSE